MRLIYREVAMLFPLPHVVVSLAVVSFAALAQPETKNKFKLSEGEQKVLDLTNEARKKENLPPYKVHPLLCQAARIHSANMAKQRKADHVLDGKGPADRIKETGYAPTRWGENIYWGMGEKFASPDGAVTWWLKSPPHRANILKRDFEEIGLGVAGNSQGEVYYTQVFGSARKP